MDPEESELPFHSLSDRDFLKEIGTWVYTPLNSLLESKDLYSDMLENPDKENELSEKSSGIDLNLLPKYLELYLLPFFTIYINNTIKILQKLVKVTQNN